jgi:hypothetical protein
MAVSIPGSPKLLKTLALCWMRSMVWCAYSFPQQVPLQHGPQLQVLLEMERVSSKQICHPRTWRMALRTCSAIQLEAHFATPALGEGSPFEQLPGQFEQKRCH